MSIIKTNRNTPFSRTESSNTYGYEPWRFLVTGGICILLLSLTTRLPSVWLTTFSLPAAWITSLFTGAPMISAEEGYALLHDKLPILVTLECSGSTFFALLTALLVGFVAREPTLASLAKCFWVFPAAYFVTVIANSSRIMLVWRADLFSQAFLPESLWKATHYAVGVFVFLCFLTACHLMLNWRPSHAVRT